MADKKILLIDDDKDVIHAKANAKPREHLALVLR